MTLDEIDVLVDWSQKPLADEWLENLQAHFLGTERRNYYRFLYLLMAAHRPRLSLEIGVDYGLGSAHMAGAAACFGGRVIGIDLHWHDTPGEVVPRRYGNYYYILGDSTAEDTVKKVEQLTHAHGPLEFVFQDSSHLYYPSHAEWKAYSAMLGGGALWVCDDITVKLDDPETDRGLKEYWAEISAGKTVARYDEVLHHLNTMGVILL